MKVTYFILLFLFITFAFLFKKFQDKSKMGGGIALTKSLWLNYTILTWFILPIIFQFDPFFGVDFKKILLVFTVSMWTRGLLELALLFKFKKWKPVYGIAHNLFTFFLVSTALFNFSLLLVNERLFIFGLLIGLIFETYFAFFFHNKIGKDTQGESPIWFANEHDKLFKRNLAVTKLANVSLYFFNILFFLSLN